MNEVGIEATRIIPPEVQETLDKVHQILGESSWERAFRKAYCQYHDRNLNDSDIASYVDQKLGTFIETGEIPIFISHVLHTHAEQKENAA